MSLTTNQGFVSVDPATGRTLERHASHGAAAVGARLHQAWSRWDSARAEDWATRSSRLRAAASAIEQAQSRLVERVVIEVGKPISEATAEVAKSVAACRHYADHGADYLRPERISADGLEAEVRYTGLGPLLAVMPWNFPLWQVVRCMAPSLALGNPLLVKPAPNAAGSVVLLDEVLSAVLPAGSFQTLLIDPESVADVIGDPRVAAVTLTGSVGAGRAVAALAGAAGKPSVLELGGSDPFIVLGDADVDRAAEAAVRSRFLNAGQSCIAAKRFLVHTDVVDHFANRMCRLVEGLAVGDPCDPATEIGPMARPDLREALHRQVQRSVAGGARLLTGGAPLPGPGWFYAPTVLTDVRPEHPVAHEETFGPVAAILPVRSAEEAIEVANKSEFGLGATVWTSDRPRAGVLADSLDAGCVAINDIVRSDPRLPFGGVKASGYGRELGRAGALAFANTKTVYLA